MCEYPPSTLAGAPIIAKQLFRTYDLSKLHILCCKHEHGSTSELVQMSYLACDYTIVPTYKRFDLRPRRIFGPIQDAINCLRVPRILREARRIVEEKQVEAIFTIPWRCEFALAAYLLHRESGLPLYVFETDDWEAMNPHLLQGYLTRKYHAPLLEAAKQLWVTSPNMSRIYRERFEVNSDFLFHFVDRDAYQKASRDYADNRRQEEIRIVYTGSINTMFYDTMQFFCDMLNRGLTIGGRPVSLSIYGGRCPKEFRGKHVTYEGFVDSDEIPHILAKADMTFIGVSFSQNPEIRDLVQTSLYTKTIDYLAAGRPVLVISPPYSGEVQYFKEVSHVVTELQEASIRVAIEKIVTDVSYQQELCRKGVELVRSRHSMASVFPLFLHHFHNA